jgi:hypothetical protein
MAVVVVLCGAGAAVAPLFDRAHWWQWAKHIPFVPAVVADLAVFAIASAWVLYCGFRLGVRFDDHGVTVRRAIKADRYSWPEVSHFADGCFKTGDGGKIWALDVVLADGQAVTLTATAGKKPSTKILTAIGEVAARHQIPADVTGDPKTRDGTPANPGLYPDPGGTPGLRHWDGSEWSPLLQADPGRGGVEAGKPAEVWSPLPGSEQQWHDAAGTARRAGIWSAVWLAVTAAVLAVAVVLYARDLSKPHADYSLAALLAFGAAPIGLILTSAMWDIRKKTRRIDKAATMAPGIAATGDSAASPGGGRRNYRYRGQRSQPKR